MPNCRSCQKPIIFLRQRDVDGKIATAANPIDVDKHPDGNLVISLEQGLYRFATLDEKEQATSLHISHFATCPNGNMHRRRKK